MAEDYNAPGAAFSTGIQSYLVDQAAKKRQALLDAVTVAREARQAKAEEDDLAEKRADRTMRMTEFMAGLHERENVHKEQVVEARKKEHMSSIANMVPGDVMTSDMVNTDKELFGGQNIRNPKQGLEDFAKTLPPDSPALPGIQAQGAGPRIFVGNRIDREAELARQRQQTFIDQMPQGDPRRLELQQALQAEQAGLKVPPGFFAKPPTPVKDRVVFEPKTGKYFDALTHQPVTDLPANVQVDRMSDPKDTSAHDAAQLAHIDSIREHAYKDMQDASKPLMDRIDRINKLESSLDQHTDIADSTLAEQLVTLTAGGAGSGLRISQPVIDQVLSKSRTKWDSFNIALQKWSNADPKEKATPGLFFTADQKQAMRDLARAYRQKANEVHSKILSQRQKVDEATDVGTINKARTELQGMLDDAPTTSAPGPALTPQELLDKYTPKPTGAK